MFFLAPRFAIRAHERGLGVLDLRSRTEVDVAGALAAQILENPATAARRLVALSALEPDLAPIAQALEASPLRPWSRAAVLEGSGYDRLFIELTAQCNERCVHCYAEATPERTESLDLATVLDVLAAGRRLGFASVQLTGGDPLVAETCVPAASRAVELGFPLVEIYTNGLALKGETFSRLRDLGVALAFSFYSHRETAHDAITRIPGSQARTLAAIQRSVEAGLVTRAAVIVQDENSGDVEQTVALLERAGVPKDRIGVDGVRQVGRGTGEMLDLPSLASTGHDATARSAEGGFGGTLAVLPDGSVVPCIFQRGRILGNVRSAPLDAIARADIRLGPPSLPTPEEELASGKRLGCAECRLRDRLLGDRLVSLGRKALA